MEKGAGHMEGTSLPVGGVGTHAVISAHSGMASAKLFTDLDKLEIGDIFIITVCNQKLDPYRYAARLRHIAHLHTVWREYAQIACARPPGGYGRRSHSGG